MIKKIGELNKYFYEIKGLKNYTVDSVVFLEGNKSLKEDLDILTVVGVGHNLGGVYIIELNKVDLEFYLVENQYEYNAFLKRATSDNVNFIIVY